MKIREIQTKLNLYMFENLNVGGSIWHSVKEWIESKHPELLTKYERIYFSESDYWSKAEEEISRFCKEQRPDYKIYFHH